MQTSKVTPPLGSCASGGRIFRLAASLVLPITLSLCSGAGAQVFERGTDLPPAEVERIDPAAATHLENAERFLAEKQWDEAIEAIRRVMESDTGQFVPTEQRAGYTRWIPVREYCQQKLASLAATAPEALERYRRLVDPLAEQWYREAVATRNEELLRRIIQHAFASRWGDDALLLAGEFRLQVGDFSQARADWQRLSPLLTVPPALADLLKSPAGSPLWLAVRKVDWAKDGASILAALSGPTGARTGYFPDTDASLADVRARLVFVSILEGSFDRAEVELDLFKRLHPNAEGQIGGRSGKLTQVLADWLQQAKTWPPERLPSDWPTFAGNFQRNGRSVDTVDIAGAPIWTYELPKLTSDREVVGASRLRPADDMKSLLSYFPAVVDGTVLLRAEAGQKSLVTALDLRTGEAKWEVDYQRRLWALNAPLDPSDRSASDAHQGLSRHVGVARFTLSAADGKVFSRMGSPITGPSLRTIDRLLSKDQGWLIGLDLRSEGKPLEGFPIRPESSAWSFEGTPVYDRGAIYVAMRRADGPRAQIYVACFDLPTSPTVIDDAEDDSRPTGRLRWRTKIAAGATLGGGEVEELSHTLLTLLHGRLYLNTNIGAVACLSADSGKVDWIATYPRSTFRDVDSVRAEDNFFRDLNPCMIAGDYAIVAPSDCASLFALELASGRVVWQLAEGAGTDIVHLLGRRGNVLHASGDYLYWIDLQSGQILTQFPQPGVSAPGSTPPTPRGYGRGLLAGDQIYWPTRDNLYVFAQQPVKDATGWRPGAIRDIALASRGATGGNLTIADGVLLIAAGDRLYAFDQQGPHRLRPATAEVR